MSLPRPDGRGQPRRKVLKSVNSRAAVQSVLGPACGLKNVPYPPDPKLTASVRGRWRAQLEGLREQGFHPLVCDLDFRRAVNCPWRLYGLDDAKGKPCKRPGCPSCHGMEVALDVDRVLRVIGDQGTAKLRLIRATRTVTTEELDAALREPPPKTPSGYMRQVSVERLGPDAWRVTTAYLVLGGTVGTKVKPHPLSVARAVASMRPYPAAHLELDPKLLLDTLRWLAGMRMSSCSGSFRIPTQERPPARRYARAARTLSDCTPTFLPKPPWATKPVVEPTPELVPADDDGPVQILLKERPKPVEVEFERTDYLTYTHRLAELELRRLEWVPGYEEWLARMEAHWDEFWAAHDDEVEYVTQEEAAEQVQQHEYNLLEDVEAAVEAVISRSGERYVADLSPDALDGRPMSGLRARVRAIIEEGLGALYPAEVRCAKAASVEPHVGSGDAQASGGQG